MCGIAGIYSFSQSIDRSILLNMIEKLHHRGPDDLGVWLSNDHNVGLAHSRLSIHDLTATAHQPMYSASKEWILVFNGEIYNYEQLKSALSNEQNIRFISNGDTEVLINAIDIWGLEKTLNKCVGMFAFAAYNLKTKSMYLARDRFGEKPLYYGKMNDCFCFASELSALKPLKKLNWSFDVNRSTIASFMRHSYVPSPFSIFKDIFKLSSGCYLQINENGSIKKHKYWDTYKEALYAKEKPFKGNFNEAVEQLEFLLKQSISLQSKADVPLGAFLSGGVDSSTIVALMQQVTHKPVKTFSIGFHEKKYNEAIYAKEVARHLKSEHTEVYLNQQQAMKIVLDLPSIYSEPFGDSSAVPTALVSQIAKQKVSVALSGDGGDELFGGYSRYSIVNNIERIFSKIPKPLRNTLAETIAICTKGVGLFPKTNALCKNAKRVAQALKVYTGKKQLYQHIISAESFPNDLCLTPEVRINDVPYHDNLTYLEWMMLHDAINYMSEDILAKVDRAAMASSLETRVPIIDHRIFKFSCSLPISYKIKNNVGKSILKEVLYKYVPKKLIDRPKVGFSIPYDKWLRGELKTWASDLLNEHRIKQQQYFNNDKVQKYWNEHISGKRNNEPVLWNILMFNSWLDAWNS